MANRNKPAPVAFRASRRRVAAAAATTKEPAAKGASTQASSAQTASSKGASAKSAEAKSADGKATREASPWKPSSERAREREVKRDAVILAAARAFKERGYHNTTLDDIATHLNVTKPTIYYYLTNKEQILFECFRAGLGQITAVLGELAESKTPGREKLLTLMRHYAATMATEFGWCMVRVEEQDLSPAMSKRIKQLKSEIDQGIRKLITQGIQDGSIRQCDAKMAAFAVAGALNWVGHWYRGGEALTPEQIGDHFCELLDHGFRPR